MTNKNITVLWVDDQEDTFFVKKAESFDIEIIWKENWEEANKYLIAHHDEIQSLILDYHCKLSPNDTQSDFFFRNVISDIDKFNGKYRTNIPWFMRSAGETDYKANLENEMKGRNRPWLRDENIGYYSKNKRQDDNQLFHDIQYAVRQSKNLKIRALYEDVFKELDTYFKFDNFEPSNILIELLSSLHFPEENKPMVSYLYYNQLRRLIEYFFRACNKIKLLPDEFINKGKVNLWWSSKYLNGDVIKYNDNTTFRYGEPNEAPMPSSLSLGIKNILFFSNNMSHTASSDEGKKNIQKYFSENNSIYFLFSSTLLFCELISWFTNFRSSHTFDENLSKIHVNEQEK